MKKMKYIIGILLVAVVAIAATDRVTNTTTLIFKEASPGANIITVNPPSFSSDYSLTLPTDDGSANQFLTTNGSGTLSWTTGASASADVSGPASSVDGEVAVFNGGTGKVIKSATGTGFGILTSGVLSAQSKVLLASDVSGVLPMENGGTNRANTASNGGVAYSTASAISLTAVAASGTLLQSTGAGAPTWTSGTGIGKFSSGVLSVASGISLGSEVTGILPLANGGTNNANVASLGSVAYGTASGISFTTVGSSGQFLKSIGAATPTWNAVSVSSDIVGILPLANGGTNNANVASNGSVAYSTASGISLTTVGSSGQVLKSNGANVPTWAAVSMSSDVTGVLPLANGGTNNANVASLGSVAVSTASGISLSSIGSSGQVLKSNGANTPTWAAVSMSSDVTGVLSLANGGTNNANIANAGAIPYSTASVISLGPVGATGQVLQSNGTGIYSWSTPTYPSASGTTGQILRSDGTNNVYTTATYPNTSLSPSIMVANSASVFSALNGSVANRLVKTSGSAISFAQADLTTDVTGVLPLANGGTNSALVASNGALAFSTASVISLSAVGTSGQALISNGAAAPTWYAPTAGSVLYAGTAGAISQDNNGFYWDASNRRIATGISATTTSITISGVSMGVDIGHQSGDLVSTSDIVLRRFRNNGTAVSTIIGAKGRGTVAAPVIPNSGDDVFSIKGVGYDGTDYEELGNILFEVDGTPGDNDMPGRITFQVTPDGSTVLAEAMRIASDKKVTFAGTIDTAITTSGPVIADSAGVLSSESTLNVVRGGTGQSTLTSGNVILGNGTSAVSFVAPGVSGQLLTSNGSTWTSAAPPSGTGDITGPAASVDSEVAIFSGTSGKIIKRATGSGVVSVSSGVISVSSTVSLSAGGTNNSITAANGAVAYSTASAISLTSVGVSGSVLVSQGSSSPIWSPNLVVGSGATSRIEHATFTNTGSCAVATQSGSWVTSVTDPGTGQCGIVWAAGTFVAPPTCTCTVINAASWCLFLNAPTLTGVTSLTQTTVGSTDSAFSIICMGNK